MGGFPVIIVCGYEVEGLLPHMAEQGIPSWDLIHHQFVSPIFGRVSDESWGTKGNKSHQSFDSTENKLCAFKQIFRQHKE